MSKVTIGIRAIDPLALLLPPGVYARLKLPNPEPIEAILDRLSPALKRIRPAEKAQILACARALGAYAAAVEKELG